MSEIWGTITDSFDNLKKKITNATTSNPTPSPLSSNYSSIQGGGRRRRSRSKRSRSKRSRSNRTGGKRSRSKRSRSKRSRSKKVRFSKKNKVYTYKRK